MHKLNLNLKPWEVVNVGSYERYGILSPNGGDVRCTWGGWKGYYYARKISAGLLHKYIEEVERHQSTVQTN